MTPSGADKIHFIDAHAPPLESGDYEITVSLTDVAKTLWPDTTPTPKRSIKFAVAGERYLIHPAALRSCYPPPTSHGDYTGVLPHLVFHRSTLPWERPAKEGDKTRPFMLLLAFRASEAPAVQNVRARDLEVASPHPLWREHRRESTQDPDEPVTVIDVPWASLRLRLPEWENMPYLAHVRIVEHVASPASTNEEIAGDDADSLDGGDSSQAETAGAPDTEEVAVVISDQLIEATNETVEWVVHLVSIESLYETQTFTPTNDFDPSQMMASALVRLVSLFRWNFLCEAARPGLLDRLENLDGVSTPGAFRLPEINGLHPRAAQLLAAGSVPLPHAFRQGDRAVSWYRGPLLPGRAPEGSLVDLPLPARSSDALLLFDTQTGLLDASYAVAWEFGRMRALSDHAFALRLARWKRARAREAARLRRDLDTQLLPHAHARNAPRSIYELPKEIASTLEALGRLDGVPPAHLIPHPDLLPTESIRFVDLDAMWVKCLLDGALSVGRVTAHEVSRDVGHHERQEKPTPLSGFVLRSALIEEYPALEIAGYASDEQTPLPVVTRRRLGTGILLMVFLCDKPIRRVQFSLPPTVLHFGFEKEGEHYTGTSRTSGEKYTVSTEAMQLDGNVRRLRLQQLARDLDVSSPAALTLQLLCSTPQFTINLDDDDEVTDV